MNDFQVIRASNGEARIRAYARGAGPLVVLMAGLGRAPDDVVPLARKVADAGFRVLLPETRGIGKSAGKMEGLTLRDFAADVVAAIDAAGGGKAILVGHAFGNRVARAVAAYHPDRTIAVVCLGASGKVAPTPEIQKAIDAGKDKNATREQRAAALRIASFGPGRDPTPWVDGWNEAVMKACLAAASATPIQEWWTAGKAPVLIIQGLADVAAVPANGRMLVEELGARGRLVELEGVGHSIPVEAPEETAAALIPFLREQAERKAA
jgi:pimeloyl-ACP methyl ester carboxylesterase